MRNKKQQKQNKTLPTKRNTKQKQNKNKINPHYFMQVSILISSE